MSTIHRFACLTLVATIAIGSAAAVSGQEVACNLAPKQTHKLKFKLKDKDNDPNKGCVEQVLKQDDDSDATTVSVCLGDTVEWKVKSGTKKKSVAFDKGDGSPFDWTDSTYKDNKITAEVKAVVDADKSFGYSVRTEGGPSDGCPLDPVIIVRH